MGLLVPVSHASTVLADTPITDANVLCVILSLFLTALISLGEKSSAGVTVTLTFLALTLPCLLYTSDAADEL